MAMETNIVAAEMMKTLFMLHMEGQTDEDTIHKPTHTNISKCLRVGDMFFIHEKHENCYGKICEGELCMITEKDNGMYGIKSIQSGLQIQNCILGGLRNGNFVIVGQA